MVLLAPCYDFSQSITAFGPNYNMHMTPGSGYETVNGSNWDGHLADGMELLMYCD